MIKRALALAVLLAIPAGAGLAQFDMDKLVREYSKKLAKERDPRERAAAAKWLAGREKPEAVAARAKALSDPEASVRQAAASALWDTGNAAGAAKPELTRTLDDPDAAVVARAAGALAFLGVPDKELARPWRRALEGSRDDATAFLAARGLIGIDPPEKLAPPILTFLAKNAEDATHESGKSQYDDEKSAENAGKALHDLLKEGAAPLLPLLDRTVERTPSSGRYVLGALASVKTLPPGTVDLALAHTRSSVASTRDAAIALAGNVTAERQAARWIPEAIRLLGDPDGSVRNRACGALRGVKGLAHGAAPELARLVAKDPEASVRHNAVDALEAIGDVSNPIPKAAKAAVAAAAKGTLAIAMKDKDHDLAEGAVAAFNVLAIDNAELVTTLADVAVTGADTGARQRALHALQNRQGQSKGIVEQIRPLTRSPEKLIADDARTAIEWIDRGGSGSPAAIKGGGAAASAAPAETAARPAPAAPVASAASGDASPALPPPPAGEQRGMAVLRARNLEWNEPSFYRALSEADAEAIRAYLDGGMSAKHVFVDSNRRTPLMVLFFGRQACAQPEAGHAIVRLLLDRGADVNQLDEKKNSALMFAADTCDRQTFRMLLKAGAKLNQRNWSNLTALEMGIVSGNPGLEELIDAGARLDAAKAKDWAEAYKKNPRALALIKKASAP